MTFVLDTSLNLSLILAVASLLFSWWRTRRSAVDERFASGSSKMADHEKRIQTLEETVSALPGRDAMHGLQLELARMGGDMKAINVAIQAIADSQGRLETVVTRHEDYMRENR